mgnify:CR=1 FL=1
MYVTINDVIQDGRRRPFEVFINSKNMEHYAWTVGLTRMISAVFRRGGDISFVVEELKAVFDPRGGSWVGGRYVPSLLAAIGEVIERHLIAIGFMPDPRQDREELERMVARKVANLSDGSPVSDEIVSLAFDPTGSTLYGVRKTGTTQNLVTIGFSGGSAGTVANVTGTLTYDAFADVDLVVEAGGERHLHVVAAHEARGALDAEAIEIGIIATMASSGNSPLSRR